MKLYEVATLLATLATAGWVSAYLVQLIKRPQWPSWVKLVLSIVMAAIVGLATAWLTGDVTQFVDIWKSGGVTAEQVITFTTLIYTAASVWYYAYFKKADWATTVENVGKK